MMHEVLQKTVFGEVLAKLMEKRGLQVTPFKIGKFSEEARVDGWKLVNRMATPNADYPGPLGRLVDKLDLSREEMMDLAFAYAFERRPTAPPRPTMTMLGDDED